MVKWTDRQLRKEAKIDYLDCRDCGHYPDWTNEPLTNELIEKWSKEYDMTPEQFKKYVEYFYEQCN